MVKVSDATVSTRVSVMDEGYWRLTNSNSEAKYAKSGHSIFDKVRLAGSVERGRGSVVSVVVRRLWYSGSRVSGFFGISNKYQRTFREASCI